MIVGIIGSGIAGLSCAHQLESYGIASIIFDKGKRPGGRMSSLVLEDMAWDFGAQYFCEGTGSFALQVTAWKEKGLVSPWIGGPDGALVGNPSMASLVEAQCDGRDVRFGTHVQRIDWTRSGWWVLGPELREGPFDAIIVAVPPEQAIPLISLHDFTMASELIGMQSQPCWTAMVAFSEPLVDVPAFMREITPIAWAARNNSKPGRPDTECWVLQAGLDWSIQNLEIERNEAADGLLAAFADCLGMKLPKPIFLKAHRWRFSQVSDEYGRSTWNKQLRLGVCGDWCVAPRIEGAWQSGQDAAALAVGSLIASAENLAINAKA